MKEPRTVLLKKCLSGEKTPTCALHPWIFSGAIAKEPDGLRPGDTVRILDSRNKFIGYGHYNPLSKIRIRLLGTDENRPPDDQFMFDRIRSSIESRKGFAIDSDSARLIFSESDFLPGLVADKYGDIASIQCLTAGMDSRKEMIASFLLEILEVSSIVERDDCEIRRLEGLEPAKGILAGDTKIPSEIWIRENGFRFMASPLEGQKTGFYLDQRDNRLAAGKYSREGMDILDCFSFTGSFSVYTGHRAGSLTLVDESQPALDLAGKNLAENMTGAVKTNLIRDNAFQQLRKMRDRGLSFDMVILDPPKFAPGHACAEKASKAYKDINLLGMKLLRPNGILCTFSCSSAISRETLREIIFMASRDGGRNTRILSVLGQPPDHPILLNFPESEYLKGFVCQII